LHFRANFSFATKFKTTKVMLRLKDIVTNFRMCDELLIITINVCCICSLVLYYHVWSVSGLNQKELNW